MITKMKKLTFLIYNKEYDAFLEQLREQGVVHIVERQRGEAEGPLADKLRMLHTYEAIMGRMLKMAPDATTQTITCVEASEVAQYVTETEQEINTLQQQLPVIDKDLAALQVWGNFDQRQIDKLHDAGWQIQFCVCPEKDYLPEWEDEFNAVEVNRQNGKIYFVTVTSHKVELPVEPVRLPGAGWNELTDKKDGIQAQIERHTQHLRTYCKENYMALAQAVSHIKADIDLLRVKLNGEEAVDGSIMVLEGWIPADKVEAFAAAIDSTGQYYEVNHPTPEDDIPIQMSNNRFFRLFEPLTKLYMLPSNGELDLTPFFAPFFMIFFGLCLGDMGYGALMIVAMPLFDKLFKLINPQFSKWLVPLFGGSTMVCGLLTGSAFGFNLYEIDIPFFQQMKALFYLDNQQMFTLSLIIGVVQILFGMILKAVNMTIQCGFRYAISTIGWVILLVTIGVAYLTGAEFGHPVVMALLIAAAVCIFLLNSPGKNVFLNIGLGLWDSYNMATGLLGDVLSYIRLFALGLSGGILASVFNSLAVGMSPKVPVLGFLVMALIFMAGHAINIFMNFLGAIVHPMRLTFVEFFKNAGYTGGGKEYAPFRKEG